MEQKIINKYFELKSVKKVSKIFDKTEDAISRILAKHKILDFLTLNEEEKANIVSSYKNNMTVNEINKKFKYGSKRINYVLIANELMRKRTSKYVKDETVFEEINNEEKAYWLGFLYADGYVSNNDNIELSLQKQDKNHLDKFKLFLKTDTPIKLKRIKLNNKEFISYRLIICSKKINNDLIQKGCINKKSLTLTFPNENILPKEFRRHFIRGYVDGDGCITRSGVKNPQTTLKVEGTEFFLKDVAKIIKEDTGIEISSIKKSNRGQHWTLAVAGNIKTIKALNYLYDNSNIYLDRKKDKYLAVLS